MRKKLILDKYMYLALIMFFISGLIAYFVPTLDQNVSNLFKGATKDSFLTPFFIFITHMGSVYALSAIAILFLLLPMTRKNIGIPMFFSFFASSMLFSILKSIFKRPRPNINRLIGTGGYSFPSGHSATSFSIYFFLMFMCIIYIKNKNLKIILVIVTSILPILIAFSRVYLGVHYLTDVIAGSSIGIFFVLFLIKNLNLYSENPKK